jgi:hypothetical protein
MNSRLVVNGYELDLSDNIAVPLNLSITDIKEPEKRKRSFSKTITLEGTSNNMAFFIGAYALDVNLQESSNIQFTPNLRYDCEFFKNDLLIFKGKFKLNEVKILNDTYTFDCNLLSDAVDIFAKLKDKKLNELNWSEYDHELSMTNIINTWSSGIHVNNVFTRNFGSDAIGYQPQSYGYIYPLVDYGYTKPSNNAAGNFRTNQLYPFIYVKEAVKKCLDYALEDTNIEVDYTTTFFDNANMKKLIYGFGGGEQIKFNSDQINSYKVDLDGGFPSTTISGKKIVTTNSLGTQFVRYEYGKIHNVLKLIGFTGTPVYDVNQINAITGEIEINASALYNITFSADLYFTYTGSRFTAPNDSIDILVNGISVANTNWDQNKNVTLNKSVNAKLKLKTGDKVSFQFTFNEVTQAATTIDYLFSNIQINLDADKDAVVTDLSTISLSSAIPDIKCSDFLKGVLNLFYAYMSDPIYDATTNKSTIYIDSFVNYYEDQSIYDNWTDLIDDSKDITIQSNSLVEGNVYSYRFSEEKDKFNTEYKTITGSNYGEKQINVDTWLNGTVKFELPFATYPPVKPENKTFVYPIVINEESKPYKGKGMLMFYNGLRSGNVTIFNCANDSNLPRTEYPFCHHIRYQNNQNNIPLFDLHFAPRDFEFDGLKNVPTLNTFKVYHDKFLNEITSIDSKLVTLYLKLTYKDINELDFAKLKMIDGVLYRLNTIKDFDSDAYGTTEVELIKFLG